MTDKIEISPETVAAMLDGVTPGPWRDEVDESAAQVQGFPIVEADGYTIVGLEGMYGDLDTDFANARFIAWAREAVPALSARLAEVEAERDAAREALMLVGAERHQWEIDARRNHEAAEAAEAKLAKAVEALVGGRDAIDHALYLLPNGANQRKGMQGALDRINAALAEIGEGHE